MNGQTKDIQYWVGFSFIPNIGRVRLGRLESHFGNLENAWKANSAELTRAGLDAASVRAVVDQRPRVDLDTEMEKLELSGASVFTWRDDGYPARLREIHDYPPILYVKGAILPDDEWSLGVVGTRRASAYGRQVTEEIVTDLARSRITIVSGLARGIDAAAHRAALGAGGRTIAVCGSGLDIVYPDDHTSLAQSIIEHGALLSEYPLGTKPLREHFPRRNRILSGISLGVLIVEADIGSGALITAGTALEQNREVLAVPGSILSPGSRGANRLIQEGAKLVRDCGDVLEELNLGSVAQQMELPEILPESDTEAALVKKLSAEPKHIDEVCRDSGLPVATVSSALAMMEIRGMVKSVGNMKYVLAREARPAYRVVVD